MTLVLILFVMVAGGFAIAIMRAPDEFKVSRSAIINGSPEKVFPHINELTKWQEWSVWARIDPNAQNTYEGPAAGTGAIMRWVGNRKVGSGSAEITESRPNEYIKLRLDFLKPMKATNYTEFKFKPVGENTEVVWEMVGKSNLMGKIMGLLMNCDKMVGGQFEQGLQNLNEVVILAK